MPYIDQTKRGAIDSKLIRPASAGELNYQITSVIKSYWVHSARNYQAINDIVGALEGAKLEFYRRVVADYENQKAKENGDCY